MYRAYWQSGHIALDRLEGGWRRSNDEVIPKIASSGEWTVSVNADVTGGYSVQIYRREVQLFTERLMSTIAGRRPASVAIQVDDRPGGVHALTLALVGHDLVGNGIMEVWRLTVVGSSELVARRQVSGNPCPWFGVNTALMDDRLYISEWGIGPLGKVWIVDLSDVDKEATITELVCESGSHDFGVDMFVPRNGVLVFGDSGRVHVYNLNRGVVYEVRVAPGSGLAYQELIRFGYAVDGFVDGDVLKLAIGCPLVSLRDDSSDETGLREAVFEAHVPL